MLVMIINAYSIWIDFQNEKNGNDIVLDMNYFCC